MFIALLLDETPPDARRDELDLLTEVAAVEGVLRAADHEVVRIPFTLDLSEVVRNLTRRRPDVVFNLVESVVRTGRLVHLAPALLDSLSLPYTGADTQAMFLTACKTLTKRWLQDHDLPTPGWCELDGRSTPPRVLPPAAEPLSFSGRWIIKSVWEEASVGLDEDSVLEATNLGDLQRAMDIRRFDQGGDCFAERYVEGREFNVSLLAGASGVEVLPPAEIRFDDYPPGKPRVVGYRAKWVSESFEYRHTRRSLELAGTDRDLVTRLESLAARCWELFRLDGYARIDFRVDNDGQPWILEVNTNPCLSPDAGLAAAAAHAGHGYDELIARILAGALR